MTKARRKYRLVSVQWIDAESDCEWTEHEKLKDWANEECIIHEVGWLVSETLKYIVITNQITYDGVIGNKTKIPQRWIKSKEFVSFEKKRLPARAKANRTHTKSSS